MLTVKAYSLETCYRFVVTDGTEENTYTYDFVKQPPEGVTTSEYLQNCKSESLALAQWEIDQKAPPEELVI
jgi:hypothetical protein